MSIVKVQEWEKCVQSNTDPYGKCIVDVARRVMQLLDDDSGPIKNAYGIILQADEDIHAGGITGHMFGFVENIVSNAHSRGDEFKAAWNKYLGIQAL